MNRLEFKLERYRLKLKGLEIHERLSGNKYDDRILLENDINNIDKKLKSVNSDDDLKFLELNLYEVSRRIKNIK